MKDEDKRKIVEAVGLCWHEVADIGSQFPLECECGYVGDEVYIHIDYLQLESLDVLGLHEKAENIKQRSRSMNVTVIAMICYEANRVLCVSQEDRSQPLWVDTSREKVESVIGGVKFVIDNPEATPEDQHNAWLKSKESEGWRYGEVKDSEEKTHPCMLPYADLPIEQRMKDNLFQGIVRSLVDFIEPQDFIDPEGESELGSADQGNVPKEAIGGDSDEPKPTGMG